MCKKNVYILFCLFNICLFLNTSVFAEYFPFIKPNVCNVEIINVTNVFCNGELATLTFDLNYTDPGASGQFVATDNYGNSSIYNYTDLPVTFVLTTSVDELETSFTVCDLNNTNCCDVHSVSNPCYQPPCGFDFITIDPICDNGVTNVFINFDYDNGNSTSFVVTDHFGNTSTHNYSDLPITFTMNGSVDGLSILNFQVCDGINTGCCDLLEIENPCPWCEFGDLNVTAACNDNSSTFNVVLDFDAVLNSSEYFYVKINDIIQGVYNYSELPITISNLEGDCVTTRLFEVEDVETGDCVSEFELEPLCCTLCEISNITFQNIICNNNNTVLALLDMDYQGNGNGNFTVTDNFGISNIYAYANLPLVIELNGPNDITQIGINICDQEYVNCCTYIEIANPCFSDEPPCNLDVINPNVACSNNNIASITFDLSLAGEGNSGFVVTDNYDNTSTHSYDDLPLTLTIETDQDDQNLAIWICDVDNPNCCTTYEFVNPCYESISCNVEVSEVQNIICSDGDNVSLVFNLAYSGEGDSGFTFTDEYGNTSTHSYANIPILINITAPVDDSIVGFHVCDVDFPNCCAYYEFANPCYDNAPECYMSIAEAYSDCVDDYFFEYHFNINYQAPSDSLMVWVNDSIYGSFSYSQLPLTITGLIGDCETTHVISVQDKQNVNCTLEIILPPVCCEPAACSLEVSSLENVMCIGQDSVIFNLDLDYENTDSIGFTLYDYVGNLTTYTYDQLPIVVKISAASNVDELSFVVCDIGNSGCCTTYNLDNPCYIIPPCTIEIIDIQNVVCTNGDIASVTFNLAYSGEGNNGFVVMDDDGNVSIYNYSDLPLTIEVLAPLNDELIGFQVCDVELPNCCDYIEFSNPCYIPPVNRVINTNINIQQIENSFNLLFDIEHNLEPNCTFTILVNDEPKGTLIQADTLALVGPINCTSTDSFKLEILSNCLHMVVWDSMLYKTDIDCLSSSLGENAPSPSIIFNSIDNVLKIDCNSNNNCSMRLFDVHGRHLLSRSTIKTDEIIDLSVLNLGIYIVVLQDDFSKKSITKKIIVLNK